MKADTKGKGRVKAPSSKQAVNNKRLTAKPKREVKKVSRRVKHGGDVPRLYYLCLTLPVQNVAHVTENSGSKIHLENKNEPNIKL